MGGITIFKFGGASVKSADGVDNLLRIVRQYQSERIVVVVSAMGKTTNALERVLAGYMEGNIHRMKDELDALCRFHLGIASELERRCSDSAIVEGFTILFDELTGLLMRNKTADYDYHYDQVVSYGELFSTTIISRFLAASGLHNCWVDIRSCLKTDSTYREAAVDYELSASLCRRQFTFAGQNLYLTQGFIASDDRGATTTLGREGSDYSAAILANFLSADRVVIWKDVEGVLNADPRIFSNTCKLDFISYHEAIELAYCGAQIIHPKTIKPLQNGQIPLYVKSFNNPEGEGSCIAHSNRSIDLPPVYVLKPNQVLISLTPRDFSFVVEDCLSKIFAVLYNHRVKVNLIQNSAINFTVCVDNENRYLPAALEELRNEFEVKYNDGLELLTIRHYTAESIRKHSAGRTVYLQQRTRTTARFVMQSSEI